MRPLLLRLHITLSVCCPDRNLWSSVASGTEEWLTMMLTMKALSPTCIPPWKNTLPTLSWPKSAAKIKWKHIRRPAGVDTHCMCHQAKEKWSPLWLRMTKTRMNEGHMITGHMPGRAVIVPPPTLGSPGQQLQETSRGGRECFQPQCCFLAPVHLAEGGNLRNFSRAARVICAQRRGRRRDNITRVSFSFFFPTVESCSKLGAAQTFRNVPPLWGRIIVFHPEAAAQFFFVCFIFPPWRNCSKKMKRERSKSRPRNDRLLPGLKTKPKATSTLCCAGNSTLHGTRASREFFHDTSVSGNLSLAGPVWTKPRQLWHLQKVWTCSTSLSPRRSIEVQNIIIIKYGLFLTSTTDLALRQSSLVYTWLPRP